MRTTKAYLKNSNRLPMALLILVGLPLGCSSTNTPAADSGGSSQSRDGLIESVSESGGMATGDASAASADAGSDGASTDDASDAGTGVDAARSDDTNTDSADSSIAVDTGEDAQSVTSMDSAEFDGTSADSSIAVDAGEDAGADAQSVTSMDSAEFDGAIAPSVDSSVAVDAGEDGDKRDAPDGRGMDASGDDTGPEPSCMDKAANGNETDTDCGGTVCPRCGTGKTCKADSDCKSGSCASGKCGDPFAPTATITNVDNIWKLAMGSATLEVDQSATGMVSGFSLNGTNVLVTHGASNGSVFWTSPQSDWNWPPPDEMYSSAYTPSTKDNVLTMASPAGTDGLTITKRYWGNVDHKTVTLEYTVKNGTSAAINKAPWEITRVYPGGLTFFPIAETPVGMSGACNCFLAVPFTTAAGTAWFKYQTADFTQDIKSGADGLEGWAAHINCGAGLEQTCPTGAPSLVLIKEWDDTATPAPGEKEVEIYANAAHSYVEFEQQGNFQSVPAGGTMVWTMHWLLRALPNDVAPTVGNADLLKWVRSQLL